MDDRAKQLQLYIGPWGIKTSHIRKTGDMLRVAAALFDADGTSPEDLVSQLRSMNKKQRAKLARPNIAKAARIAEEVGRPRSNGRQGSRVSAAEMPDLMAYLPIARARAEAWPDDEFKEIVQGNVAALEVAIRDGRWPLDSWGDESYKWAEQKKLR